MADVLITSTDSATVTQVVLAAVDPTLRLTQGLAEVLYVATPVLHLTQGLAEVLYVTTPVLHLTQGLAEVLYVTIPALQLTQGLVEVLYKGFPTGRLTDAVSVSQTIGKVVTHPAPITSSGTVTQTIAARVTPVRESVTSAVTVTSTALGRDAINRQSVSSVVTAASTTAGHDAVAHQSLSDAVAVASVLVRAGQNNQSLSDAVAVASDVLGHKTPVVQSLSDAVAVASDVAYADTHQFVAHAVAVTDGVGFAGISDILHQHDAVSVAQDVAVVNPVHHLSVEDFVLVNPEARVIGGRYPQSVAHAVGVAQDASGRDAIVRVAVAHAVSVASVPGFPPGPREVHMSVGHAVGATQVPSGRNTVIRMAVAHAVGAASPGSERVTPDRQSVADALAVASSVAVHSDGAHLPVVSAVVVAQDVVPWTGRLGLTSVVTVSQAALGASDHPRVSASHAVAVSQVAQAHVPVNRQSVAHAVLVPQYPAPLPPIVALSSSRPVTVRVFVSVSHAVAGGPDHRRMAVSDRVSVRDAIRTNDQAHAVRDAVTVGTLIGGTGHPLAVSDLATVTSRVLAHITYGVAHVADTISVVSTVHGQSPRVSLSVVDRARCQQFVTTSRLPAAQISDGISVGSFVRISGPISLGVAHAVTVAPGLRFTPVSLSASDAVRVSQRSLTGLTVGDAVTVAQAIGVERGGPAGQGIAWGQQATGTRIVTRHVSQALAFSDASPRSVTFTRATTQSLAFSTDHVTRRTTLAGFPLLILPSATGAIVSDLVTLATASGVVTLPPPLFDDAEANVQEVSVKRSMTGRTFTFVKSTDGRRVLTYTFRVGTAKALELRRWAIAAVTAPVTLRNWKGETWTGYLSHLPVELVTQGRRAGEGETVDIVVTFEGIKTG